MGRYKAGALQRELAEAYGIDRRTAIAIIKRHGASVSRGLTEAQIELAIVRYGEGASLATIGRELGVDGSTVRSRLVERGVSMRDSHGRPRAQAPGDWPQAPNSR